jgi:hypothetical protein
MSRGNGSLQLAILAHVRGSGGGSTLESIRWAMLKETGNLPKAWTYALERAVRGLSKRGYLTVQVRPLATLQEWVTHYPCKTYRREIRQMRLDLLPVLVEWIRSDEGPRPLYSADENERFYARGEGGSLNKRLRGEDRGVVFSAEWKALEPQLRRLLAQTDSDALFYLIARGKLLFTGAHIQTRASFGEMIDRCAEENVLPVPLEVQLRSLASRFLPPEQAGSLELKSVIYRFITSVIHGHPDLKPEALEALYKKRPDYLKAIAGFKPPEERKVRGFFVGKPQPGGSFEKGSPLARLIDQTTFQKFRFLSLSAAGTAPAVRVSHNSS